jgi:hypothetical protein
LLPIYSSSEEEKTLGIFLCLESLSVSALMQSILGDDISFVVPVGNKGAEMKVMSGAFLLACMPLAVTKSDEPNL